MTPDEHRAAAAQHLAAAQVDDGRLSLSWARDATANLAAAQVHATLAQGAEQADLLRGLQSLAQEAHEAEQERASAPRRGWLDRLTGGGR
ncbi:hypothetical protein [Actinoalloteichus sp. GBA129-24]|uniref:hypothetical protein n=1 Tax=Actinoalloteichus sp. GBA129-24 TaxID=1612551 RepID=UPI0009507031|nr:hypothetical protein [Actinoalloteichus sp. GBA129-24]APU20982.1 hypothetical protein UA75_14860 [Actinoalloteichus sp. GBA129-24]APU24231.1 hypothetical protein UA75_31340 [Actinoalloteichus sp. GBA129-24]